MFANILIALSDFIVNVISHTGYAGVVGLMAIESANIPLPSEVIMPFSGFLVVTGTLNFWWVAVAGAFGCVVGSVISYWVGATGGRSLIEKYGKYILVSHHDLDQGDRWFKKYGDKTVFFARLLPVIRTFISFPAGIARMNFKKFVIYTFLGSLPWTAFLTYVGMKMGANWEDIKVYFHKFDLLIGLLIILFIVWWVRRHLKK
jgi:membrane protein DedA with SNARE-associated domain